MFVQSREERKGDKELRREGQSKDQERKENEQEDREKNNRERNRCSE